MAKLIELFDKIRERRNIILIFILIIILISCSCIGIYFKNQNSKMVEIESKQDEKLITKNNDKDVKSDEKKDDKLKLRVEVKGEVIKPGVYTLDDGKRVIDLINKADGLTRSADTSFINLSKKLVDEMVVIVYSKQEVIDFKRNSKINKESNEICKQEVVIYNKACIDNDALLGESSSTKASTKTNKQESSVNNKNEENKDKKISINNATLEELMTLPSIGEAKAKKIIEYRTKEGKFETIEDIMKVSGIGEALFNKIKDNIAL